MKSKPTNNKASLKMPSSRIEAEVHGFSLNKMCNSFDSEINCQKFKDFPEAYCHEFKLNEAEIHAVTDLDVVRMIKAGGLINSISKLTQIYGLDVLKLGAQQTAQSLDEFTDSLRAVSE